MAKATKTKTTPKINPADGDHGGEPLLPAKGNAGPGDLVMTNPDDPKDYIRFHFHNGDAKQDDSYGVYEHREGKVIESYRIDKADLDDHISVYKEAGYEQH